MIIKGVPPYKERAPRIQQDFGEQRLIESRINLGMITTIDSADIPSGALQLAKNVTIRYDRTKRRPGSVLLMPVKPDSSPILKLAFVKSQDGSPYTVRMTPTTINIRKAAGWTPITFATPLTGNANDRFTTADILDKFIFTNNGADPIQTIDFDSLTGGPLGDAPNYRYVIGFFNRAVGFARRGASEVEVGWSADGKPHIWDFTINESAGSTPLLESPADLSDFIKGAVAFTNVAVVFREKSIWLVNKQPIAQNPFYFYTGVPGIGCDCPYSIQIVSNGLAWAERRRGRVYAYTIGGNPEILSTQIEKDLKKDLIDPDAVWGGYNQGSDEYTLFVPIAGGVVRGYTYSFITKAWAINEYVGLTSSDDSELAIAGLSIDELPGLIDDLAGSIDELSQSSSIVGARSYGYSNGDILLEDETVNDDNGIAFDSVIISKSFVLPEVNQNIGKILIEYQCSRASTLKLEYTKDNGTTWILAKEITTTVFNKPKFLTMKRVVRARRFTWRLTITNGDTEILSFEVYTYPSGPASSTD